MLNTTIYSFRESFMRGITYNTTIGHGFIEAMKSTHGSLRAVAPMSPV